MRVQGCLSRLIKYATRDPLPGPPMTYSCRVLAVGEVRAFPTRPCVARRLFSLVERNSSELSHEVTAVGKVCAFPTRPGDARRSYLAESSGAYMD